MYGPDFICSNFILLSLANFSYEDLQSVIKQLTSSILSLKIFVTCSEVIGPVLITSKK